jgi:hypothetical protein
VALARTFTLASLVILATSLLQASPPDGWRIDITATMADIVDRGRFTIGATTPGLLGLDDHDEPQPPALPSRYIDLVSEHGDTEPGWTNQQLATQRYRAEYGPPLGLGGRTIDLAIDTDRSGTVTLVWPLVVDPLLGEHTVLLRDVDAGTSADMHEETTLAVDVTPGSSPLQIEITYGRPPRADFTWTPTAVYAEYAVRFLDRSRGTIPGGVLTTWEWDFENDGVVDSRLRSPFHEFPDAGTYDVFLRVTEAGGATDTIVKQVVVNETVVDLRVASVDASGVPGNWQTLAATGTARTTGPPPPAPLRSPSSRTGTSTARSSRAPTRCWAPSTSARSQPARARACSGRSARPCASARPPSMLSRTARR